MKSNIPIPDVVIRGGAPLDNSVNTDLSLFETSEQSDDHTLFFNHLHNINPQNTDIIHSANISSQDPSWGEVSGNWLNHPNSASGLNGSNHTQSLWYDGDQIDVPLLNSVTVFVKQLHMCILPFS